jgi:glycosyltransferase involved in cell wall biosynthesis
MIEVVAPAESEATIRNTSAHVAWLGHKSRTIGDGLRTYSTEVTAGLARRGAEILFIHHEESLADGHLSHALKGHVAFQRRLTIAGSGAKDKLAELLRHHDVDVVHLSAPFSTLDFQLPGICHELGIPVVATFHVPFAHEVSAWGALAAFVYRRYVRALSACDGVIVLGEAQRRLLIELGVPGRLMTVLPNGVDIAKYRPGPSTALQAFDAERLFSFVGRVDPEKRVETLIRAFLATSPPDSLKLVIAGDGVDLPRLRRRYGDRRIVFLGTVLDERRRIDILRASDAFFLPSRVEALSLALLEAMASGVAVAASAVGNHPEVIAGAGILLRSSRLFDDLKAAISGFIESPARCRSLGALARERAVELFSLDAHIEALIELYGALATRLGRPA